MSFKINKTVSPISDNNEIVDTSNLVDPSVLIRTNPIVLFDPNDKFRTVINNTPVKSELELVDGAISSSLTIPGDLFIGGCISQTDDKNLEDGSLSFIQQTARTWGFNSVDTAAIRTISEENATWALNRGNQNHFASVAMYTNSTLTFRLGLLPVVGPVIPTATGAFRILDANNVGVQLTPSSTTWTIASDIRYKENIVDLEDGMLNKLMNLRTIQYSLINEHTDHPTKFGIIAQEIQENGLGTIVDGEEDYLGVRYTELIPVLIKAIKELKTEVDALKTEVNTLKGV